MSIEYEVAQNDGGQWVVYRVQGRSGKAIAYCPHEADARFIANAIKAPEEFTGLSRTERAVRRALQRHEEAERLVC